MPIVESLNRLADTLETTSKQKREITAQDTMFLLSTKFVDEINKAENASGLSKSMLKMNKVAYSLGLPEMAQTINHLGQLKQNEIINGKSERVESQRADSIRKLYADQQVVADGEYIRLGSLKEFKEGEALDPALQPEYFQSLAQKYKTETIRQLDVSDPENPMLKVYRYNNNNELILSNSYGKNTQGFYDDLLTEDSIEHLPEPPEITDFKKELAIADRDRQAQNQEWDRRYGANSNRNKPQLQWLTTEDGNQTTAWIYPPTPENPSGSIIEVGTGNDLVGKVTSKAYKPTSDKEDIKNADVRMADLKTYRAANELVDLLVANEYLDYVKEVMPYNHGKGANPYIILKSKKIKENLEEWRKENKDIENAYQSYKERQKHSDKVSLQNELRQNEILETDYPDIYSED